MNELDIVRAWKDEAYRQSLSLEQLENLPEHPSGLVELPEELLGYLAGGMNVREFAKPISYDGCPSWDLGCTANQTCGIECARTVTIGACCSL